MVLLKDIQGQDNAVRMLSKVVCSGRIANAYLFAGPDGVGKKLTAKAFLMALMCKKSGVRSPEFGKEPCGECPACRKINDLSHPDVMWITPGSSKNIRIDDIRKAKDMLSLKPYESSMSACVIEDAHAMREAASNALLKILEEPPGRALFILITGKKELLLPTVVSRCAEVRFNALPFRKTGEIIMRESISRGKPVDKGTAGLLAYFFEGSPGRALEMLERDLVRRKSVVLDLLGKLSDEKEFSFCGWDREEKELLIEDIELLMMILRDAAVGGECNDEFVLDKSMVGVKMYDVLKKYSPARLYGLMEKLIVFKRDLEGNVNPKIVAQALTLELAGEK